MPVKTKIEVSFAEAMDFVIKGLDLQTDEQITVTANYANSRLSGLTVEFDPKPVVIKVKKNKDAG